MKQSFQSILNSIPNFLRYLLVLLVVVFISFLFPNNVIFKYQFENGQSWRYDDLIAPFDFAIKKSAEELLTEKEEIQQNFSPFYEMNLDIVKEQKRLFEESFSEHKSIVNPEEDQFVDVLENPNKYINYGKRFLDRLYQRGILQLLEEHKDKPKDFVINVIRGNTTNKHTIQNLFNSERAKEMLSDSLPYSRLPEPEFIFPLLEDHIVPNIFYNDTLTQKFQQDQLAGISSSIGMVRKGELIIPKDGIVTESAYHKLLSFKEQYQKEITEKKSFLGVFIGYFLLTSLIVGVFLVYLRFFAKEIFEKFSRLTFILMWLVVFSYLVYVVENTDILSAYLIPFCIVPIVIKNFYNVRLALFTHIIVVLIASFLSSLGYEFTFLQILAGIVVLLSDVDTRDWSRFFYSILAIFLTYSIAFLGLSLIQEGTLITVDWSIYTWIFINVILTLLAYPLIPLLERLFGFTSSFSLLELSDMNRPLLRDLALKAPGTLQHSLQVANLAESAARVIGANHLLVKVASLYHDIGKTLNPEYFIENQSGNNPHKDISFLESAKMIISHVTDGEKMAKKARVPSLVTDFITTHHGTTRVEYFYRNYIKENPDKEFDESIFRYPGPRPTTKEQTLMMLADSIEAACKSLKNPSGKELDEFIDKIINGKIQQQQLEESKLAFHELEQCKDVFKKVMRSVHHVRIEYPKEVKKE